MPPAFVLSQDQTLQFKILGLLVCRPPRLRVGLDRARILKVIRLPRRTEALVVSNALWSPLLTSFLRIWFSENQASVVAEASRLRRRALLVTEAPLTSSAKFALSRKFPSAASACGLSGGGQVSTAASPLSSGGPRPFTFEEVARVDFTGSVKVSRKGARSSSSQSSHEIVHWNRVALFEPREVRAKKTPAASYSPTWSPMQYHWRWQT